MSFVSFEAKPFDISLARHCTAPSLDTSAQLCVIKELGLEKGVVVLRQSLDNGYLYLLSN